MVYIKLAVVVVSIIGTAAAAQLLFTTTFAGLSFLNSSSLRHQNKKDTLTKKVESMSAAKLEKLLVAVKERRR